MNAAVAVLFAVANELAELAKSEMPKLRDGERIQREWYENGIYSRETIFNGEVFISQYDFRERKVRYMAVVK